MSVPTAWTDAATTVIASRRELPCKVGDEEEEELVDIIMADNIISGLHCTAIEGGQIGWEDKDNLQKMTGQQNTTTTIGWNYYD